MMQMKEYKEVPQDVPQDDTVVRQPTSADAVRIPSGPENWMSIPVGMPNCPQGLEYLTALDQLLVSQKIEKLELLTGFETKNRFKIKNSLGQNVYFAYEESDCCTRNMLGRARPFEMKILDNFQNEVLHLTRPFRCDLLCCFPDCLNAVEVSAPPGQVIGTVEQVCTFLRPKFNIKNSFGDTVLHIEGPICPCKCFSDTNFKVLSANNEEIGKISKQWSGLGRELFTDADYFSVTFPLNLDVRMKALIFAALFLIDVVYYEH
ncbi:phospholipid scramblase 1 [Drosophila persimilis]|uniref:Phospholipid scramblase n=1 Tax=Drosophila pseudoobscura pseudoobscura TaxID=46245 RepID=Q2LZA4_DROPS|nr:phospholipid scramblase 1 [Drosophila pseudoobscura]XP_026847864.1 phospholipid scramblase 1 [Drosophila persimilis]XP_026847865.1 phospholipid scramblase 1 [Drosophila persimilis]